MNREINFRGQRITNNEMVYGDLVMVRDAKTQEVRPNIVISIDSDVFEWVEVIPNTVGQFTGLKDKKGFHIYEGDFVVGFENGIRLGVDTIVFEYGAFKIKHSPVPLINFTYSLSSKQIEVIGHIHQKPDKLKEQIALKYNKH